MQNARMSARARALLLGLLWLAITAAGCVVLGYGTLEQARAAFDADARAAHRALSEEARRQEVLLATLVALQPVAADGQAGPEQRLVALHPEVVRVQRRDGLGAWFGAAWATRLRSDTLYRVISILLVALRARRRRVMRA